MLLSVFEFDVTMFNGIMICWVCANIQSTCVVIQICYVYFSFCENLNDNYIMYTICTTVYIQSASISAVDSVIDCGFDVSTTQILVS